MDKVYKQFGCMCVPYFLCDSNDTIITDGAGLIDPRSSSGKVDLDEPDFIPPPPTKVKYDLKCGRRNFNDGSRIKGSAVSESKFGEWPHMCAVLYPTPDKGNLYQVKVIFF